MIIRTLQRLLAYVFPSLRHKEPAVQPTNETVTPTVVTPTPAAPVPVVERTSEPTVTSVPQQKTQPAAEVLKPRPLVEPTVFHAYVGDITKYEGDAIVNAANSHLAAGGGVCGAIFRAAGHIELQNACDDVGFCPTGSARVTPGFALPAKYVVHAVGPIFEEGQDNAALLASAYRSSLQEALRVGAKSIAFPAISTGIYGYPLEEATTVAVKAVAEFCAENPGIERVDFTCFSPEILAVYQEALAAIAKPQVSYSPSM